MLPDQPTSAEPVSVLIVSDAPATAESVRVALSREPVGVAVVGDPRSLPPTELYDIVIVDCSGGLAGAAQTVRLLRRRWPTATIVGIALATEPEAVTLMDIGADSVVLASASLAYRDEVLRAAARRMRQMNSQLRVTFGDLVYDREASRLWCAGREVELTRRELQVFDCLFVHAETPVSVEALQDYVWREELPSRSNPVAVYVRYLRRKLVGSRVASVATLRGRGYQLTTRR